MSSLWSAKTFTGKNFNRAILYQYTIDYCQTWYLEWHSDLLLETESMTCRRRVQSAKVNYESKK